MKKKYTWRILGLVVCLLFGLVTVSCNKDKDELTEEQIRVVLANAEVVMDNVSNIYKISATVEEMAQHLDEIKAMENVEDAWQDGVTICVKIMNGGIVTYSFYPKYDMNGICVEAYQNKFANTTHGKGKRACVVIQWFRDENMMGDSYDRIIQIVADLTNRGYDCDFVLGDDFTTDFICESLPNYDVVFLLTHGDYVSGKHWITTGEEYGYLESQLIHAWFWAWENNLMQVGYGEEKRNGVLSEFYYLRISEKYLQENISKNFPNNSLMFAISCKLLEGNNSMWETLREKNLGCFFGYDDNVQASVGCNALESVMNSMLNGKTASEAYQAVPANGRHDDSTGANLILCPANSNITLVENSGPTEGDWVDLGLPSGLLWATRNVGASSPGDCGDYFAWGETQPKEVYDWSTYRYCVYDPSNDCNGYNSLTKYCNDSIYGYNGFIDDLITLQLADDAATANYGGRTPTEEEWDELNYECEHEGIDVNGVRCKQYTGPNGNKLILPIAGFRYGSDVQQVEVCTFYWTASLYYPYYPYAASTVFCDYHEERCIGCTVRAVRQK